MKFKKGILLILGFGFIVIISHSVLKKQKTQPILENQMSRAIDLVKEVAARAPLKEKTIVHKKNEIKIPKNTKSSEKLTQLDDLKSHLKKEMRELKESGYLEHLENANIDREVYDWLKDKFEKIADLRNKIHKIKLENIRSKYMPRGNS